MSELGFEQLEYRDGGAHLVVKPSANNGLTISYNYHNYTSGEIDCWPETGLRLLRRALNNMAELFPERFAEPAPKQKES